MTAGTAISVSTTKKRSALREALSFFRVEWTRDHLLGNMPAVDAAILSSPLEQLHTCSVENNTSFDPVDQGRRNSDCGTILSSESVMVRAYTKDGINVGYCLSEMAGLCSYGLMGCINGASVQNFVVREHDGLYIGVVRKPHAELLVYLSCKHRTTRFYCFVFPGSVFFNLVNEGYGNDTAFERALQATVHFQYTKECFVCDGSSSAISCCNRSLRATAMKNNTDKLHSVLAKGSGLIDTSFDGVRKVTTLLNVNVNAVPHIQRSREKSFINWAVACVLKDTPLEVSRGVPSLTGIDNTDTHNGPLCNASPVPGFSSQDLLTAQRVDKLCQPVSVLEESFAIEGSFPQTTIPAPEHPPCVPNSENNMGSDALVNTESAFRHYPVATMSEPSFPSKPLNCRVILPRSTVCFETTFSLSTAFPFPPRHATPRVPRRVLPTEMRGALDIVPHPSGVPVPDEESIKVMAEELRQWKAYRRKIRNRESAMRSNLRKQRLKHASKNQQ